MPKPIPHKLLKQFEKTFHEIREMYQNGEATVALPDEKGNLFLQKIPQCNVEANFYCHTYPATWIPIPEIVEILSHLESLPDDPSYHEIL